jgi:hypothetical protein
LGLQTALQEVRNLKTQHVIEFVLLLIENASAMKATEHGRTLKETLGMLLRQGEELTRGLSHGGQSIVHPPHLAFVLQSIFTDELQFMVQALLLERATRSLNSFAVCGMPIRRARRRRTYSWWSWPPDGDVDEKEEKKGGNRKPRPRLFLAL